MSKLQLQGGAMDWATYSAQVTGSRQIIAFPFFEEHLAGKTGVGVDLGCGVGELSDRISKSSSAVIVGFDLNEKTLKQGRATYSNVQFVKGHIDKNALSELGIKFDFAFSNCCFCHIDDYGIYNTFFDLYRSLKDGGELVFLVPSIDWAEKMYSDIRHVGAGVTAVPRYGGRQFFRLPQWYVSALERCGFERIEHREIVVPDAPELEYRYRQKVGENLFSAFVAKRAAAIPNADAMKDAFNVAHENRKLEIQLFWQRSLFFWGFVAAALVGYGAAHNSDLELQVAFALFGLVCSVVWSAGNRGSKYWQEYWEEKVNYFQHYATGNIFYDRNPKKPKFTDIFAPRRMSVSKLTMALSDFAVGFWLVIITAPIFESSGRQPSVALVMTLLTLAYCVFILRKAKSED